MREDVERQTARTAEPLLQLLDDDAFSQEKRTRLAANASLLAKDLIKERLAFQSMPFLLEFSTNNKCNLHCVMCSPRGRKVTKLDKRLVERVLVDELLPNALCLLPSSGSEPFLGDLELLGAGCVKHEVQLNIITNGTLMKKDRLEAIAPVVGRLHVSLDGHRKALYESIRIGGKFERVVENVRAASGLACEKEFPLMLSAVYTTDLAREADAFVRFAADLGADTVIFQNLLYIKRNAAKRDAFKNLSAEEITSSQERAIQVAEETGIDIQFDFNPPYGRKFNHRKLCSYFADRLQHSLLRFPHICFMAATYVRIDPEGFVYPCCVGDRRLRMGNINQSSFADIWNGRAYQKLREGMFSMRYPRICKSCKHLQRGFHFKSEADSASL